MKDLNPALISSLKGYNKAQFIKDLVAGIIVAIIALPLSIALALASGVGPEQGIFTAIIAGFVISALGGSKVNIAGPTAAFATIVAGIVASEGMDGLIVATVMAGILLILMGILKFGVLLKFIPMTITTGFTAGIAVTIVIGQFKDFCGVTYPEGMVTIETMEKLHAFLAGLDTLNVHALIVGVVSLAVLLIMPKISEKIPGSLIAVLVGIAMVKFLPLNVNTIGDLYTISNSLPTLHIPHLSWSVISNALPNALTIAVLAAIESLLSCVVADGMIGSKHNSNMELVAQGAGNIASALFGGIPATGAIARTAANVKNGGRTPVAGMIHALVLLLILLVLMPYAALIPMPTIAAILFVVAYNMCQWRVFVKMVKTAPKSDILVLVITFLLTVIFDLVVAIAVGLVLACLMFMKRISDETGVRQWIDVDESHPDEVAQQANLRKLDRRISVFEITGPLFFGASGAVKQIALRNNTQVLIIRMRAVPSLDLTALDALSSLYDSCKRRGITLVFSHVNEQPYHAMEKSGFAHAVGEENFCASIDKAISHAESLLK